MKDIVQIHNLSFRPLISENRIRERVQELGSTLFDRFEGQKPLFISILSGSFVFAADLIRAFDAECEVAFVKLTSYNGAHSSGEIQMEMDLRFDIRGRQLIIVEDIVDTGRTLHFFLNHLREQQPAGICIAAFLRKPDAAEFDIPVDLIGFDIGNEFVVGYGLDYEGLGRNLPGIYQKI